MSDLRNELASLRIERDRVEAPSRWPWGAGLLLLAGVGAAAAYAARDGFGAVEVQGVRAAVVSTASAAVPGGEALLTASGYVVARRKAVVSAKIQGRLAELRVEEGDRVRQGGLLARLDSAVYEAQLRNSTAEVKRAAADLAEAQRQMKVADRLAADQLLAEDQREATASRLHVAEAMLEQARSREAYAAAQLADTRILAPFSGVVVKKMAEVGESVAPIPPGVNLSTSSGAIVALADLDTLEVEADVAESNVAKLGDGQPAEVSVEAFPDHKFRAVLRQVIPTADRTKATVQVKVTILEKDARLKPEMSAKVTFLSRAEAAAAPSAAATVVTVPAEAVVLRGGRSVVFEVSEGKAKERTIVAGGERQGQVVVKQGLDGGELLVARPTDEVKDGAAVKVKG